MSVAPSPSEISDVRSSIHSQPAIEALDAYKRRDGSKGTSSRLLASSLLTLSSLVVVRFKAVGNAPIMKQNMYRIVASNRFQAVIQFLRKQLGWKAGDPLVRIETVCTFDDAD